jgi:hypothetical protein
VSKLKKQLEAYQSRFNAQLTEGSCRGIIPFSIVSSDGKLELLRLIDAHLNHAQRTKKEAV